MVRRIADFYLDLDYSKYLSSDGPITSPVIHKNMKRMIPGSPEGGLGDRCHGHPVARQVASASQAERNWKTYGRIMTPERSAMLHEQADKRVFLYNMLQTARPMPTFCRRHRVG